MEKRVCRETEHLGEKTRIEKVELVLQSWPQFELLTKHVCPAKKERMDKLRFIVTTVNKKTSRKEGRGVPDWLYIVTA
jgi:hypothetical protein